MDVQYQTACDTFRIPSASLCFAGLPFDPLSLLAVPDAAPRLVWGYDHHAKARVNDDVLRLKPDCTHVNVTLLPGVDQMPLAVGFGAACSSVGLQNGKFIHIMPHLRHLHEHVYGCLEGLSPLQKIRHASLTTCLPGYVNNEDWRLCDSFISVALNDEQMKQAMAVVSDWTKNPPNYEVRSTRGKNCRDFAVAVAEATGVRLPRWLCPKPYPGVDIKMIEILSRNQLRQEGDWLLQPTAITRRLGWRAQGITAPTKKATALTAISRLIGNSPIGNG